jgi:hypothetical protein
VQTSMKNQELCSLLPFVIHIYIHAIIINLLCYDQVASKSNATCFPHRLPISIDSIIRAIKFPVGMNNF